MLGGRDLEVYLVDLDRFLRATTKKRSSTFFRRKVHPADKILAKPMTARGYQFKQQLNICSKNIHTAHHFVYLRLRNTLITYVLNMQISNGIMQISSVNIHTLGLCRVLKLVKQLELKNSSSFTSELEYNRV